MSESSCRIRTAHVALVALAGGFLSFSSLALTVGHPDIKDVWVAPMLLPGRVLVDQLPDVQVSQKGAGAKWEVPKAGKVAYQRDTTEVDPAKAGENPSGLKLTYKAKDGTFKGSFKVYSDMGGKLKATSVSVTGVQIGSKGYGTATVKGLGSVPVAIE